MDYIQKVLGINVRFKSTHFDNLPNYINARYQLKEVMLDDLSTIFLYPKIKLDEIRLVKNNIDRIQKELNMPVVLILNEITYRQKEYMIKEKLSFVVEGKQIYLPFMAIYLQQRCNTEKVIYNSILPSTQILYLYFIYNGAKDITTSKAAKDLNFTSMSISRASNQLADLKLLEVKKTGVQKILHSNKSPKQLFENAKNILLNPVKKTVYVSKNLNVDDLNESGILGLSKYSMLSAPHLLNYASNMISIWEKDSSNVLIDADNQIEIELWRYDPKKLSKNKMVDPLSLALSMQDNQDERVEGAIEEMLNQLWSEIDGSGINIIN